MAKFFDNVDHRALKYLLRTKSPGLRALWLLDNVIASYHCPASHGLPIGNLTSQIFANIYLNEFDQFVLLSLKPQAYIRYGDDFVLWYPEELAAKEAQTAGTQFLADELGLVVNSKHDRTQPTTAKLAYLGVDLWPGGRRLQARTALRIDQKLALDNLASYQSLVQHHLPKRYSKRFLWNLLDFID